MKKRNLLKTLLYFSVIIVIIAIIGITFMYYFSFGRFETDEEQFPHYVGYINQEKALLNDTYTLCGDRSIYKTHHGAPDDAFEGGKKQFKNFILSNYKNDSYTDSGYLNFRFLINCEGNAGWFEIIEMNLDLEESPLNKSMVKQLLKLTSDSKNWAIFSYKNQPRNYYMYISYRIENGEIVEILP
ncbi:hypothetical protein ACSIGC_10335 [Tenacibaculum sp. ZS6-P6]|uniref:hypothetical protein n=1 Tax=Tenacibaculum sp. ZS6-P6 TaxID=3447503 RepID=UPI003F96BAAF